MVGAEGENSVQQRLPLPPLHSYCAFPLRSAIFISLATKIVGSDNPRNSTYRDGSEVLGVPQDRVSPRREDGEFQPDLGCGVR